MNLQLKKGLEIRNNILIDESLEVRISENKKEIVLKLRNNKFDTAGRKLIFENIQDINEVIFGEVKYSNLSYISSETYIHNVNLDSNYVMVEDFTITFSKEVI